MKKLDLTFNDMDIFENYEVIEVEEETSCFIDFVEKVKQNLKSLQTKIISFDLVPNNGNYALWLKLTNTSQGHLQYTVTKGFDIKEFKFLLREFIK